MSARDEEIKALGELTQRHVEQLMEHCDAVQIFTQRLTEDGKKDTICASRGGGLWHARTGHVRSWIIRNDAYEKAEAADGFVDDEDDESEDE